ncbi:CHASE2 domain-containing protein [Halotia branconii]|uniref:CHASE2 domain-containing protein n=1 Tax=Halotia branconii CENA392 TaxID=1539056 RepID=A0AAJ6PAA2_9CYAN|nr:CHASE2 domain-containing protein [Halotia branconii]WGV26506.1 CHASE2 domain-containing protein [Halotia branconii CENA392]
MRKLVVLKLDGDLHLGVQVTLEIGEEGKRPTTEITGKLPSNLDMATAIEQWQSIYRSLWKFTRIKAKKITYDGSISQRRQEYDTKASEVQKHLNKWLLSDSFRPVREKWLKHLMPDEEIRVLIRTHCLQLKKLPWHLWDLIDQDYLKAEVVLGIPDSEPVTSVLQTYTWKNKIRILAILGHSDGIDVEKDRQLLEKLPNAAITFLVEPQYSDINDKLWKQPWNILFFAGHSKSEGDTGCIYINKTDQLTIDELRHDLRNAVANGLQLAIFNSCDGLGLARELQDIQIPQTIVMREPVPDLVAQKFLKYFLEVFSSRQSIYTAVRTARQRLKGIEKEYPGATWLPVISEHPAVVPMTWQLQRKMLTNKNAMAVLLTSLLVTSLVTGVRYWGYLQASELHAFDHFIQMRSHFVTEQPDERILIITIDEADIQYQINKGMQMRWSLSDQALAQLLEKLNKYQPRSIGLDIYRDGTLDPKYPNLATRFQQDNRLFFVCKVATTDDDGDTDGIPPPFGVSRERLSFSDFVADDENIARRQLLHLTPPSKSLCTTEYAFSLQLALHYLDQEAKTSSVTKEGHLQIGDIVFEQLNEHTSGYQKVDASGYQVLLNYRSLRSAEKIAEQISLRDVLDEKIPIESVQLLKDRIVIIGLSAPTNTNDYWKTPFSSNARPKQKQIPGVFVQAHMLSQILSAVLDRRPLLWWWSGWMEILWIWGWSLIGGITAWYYSKPLHLGLAVIVTLLTLFGLSFSIFILAGWIPFIPSVLGLLTTQVMVILWLRRSNFGQKR